MDKLGLVLLIFSFACFCIACWQAAQPIWNKLVAGGLAFLTAAMIFGNVGALFNK